MDDYIREWMNEWMIDWFVGEIESRSGEISNSIFWIFPRLKNYEFVGTNLAVFGLSQEGGGNSIPFIIYHKNNIWFLNTVIVQYSTVVTYISGNPAWAGLPFI